MDELDEFEDDEEEQVFLEYRRKRLQEIKNQMQRNKFGTVAEISGPDYIQEVNNAGKDIWVVLHLYKPGFVFGQHFFYLYLKINQILI